MFSITTICHKTSDSRLPLLMLTNREGYRYFIGKIPEGVQRVLNENGLRLGKLKSIFLTGTLTNWSDIGGLPGLFLTISDATSRGIDVFTNCSKIMSYIVSTWRYFVFRKGIELSIQDALNEKFVGDNTTTFRPIKIQSDLHADAVTKSVSEKIHRQLKKITSLMFPLDTSKANNPDPESYKHDPSENEIQTHVKLPPPSLLAEVNAQPSLNYVIRFLPVRGKFNPVMAKALGVKPGSDFRRLTNGEAVRNDKDELVHPNQVMEAPKTFNKVVVLDIPDIHYLKNTIENPEWYEKSAEHGMEDVGIVYHFLGDDIDFQLDEYAEFIQKFPSHCKHIIGHSIIADNTLVFKTSAVHLLKLKCILNDNFTLPAIEEHKSFDSELKTFKLQSLQQLTIDASGVEMDESAIVSESWSSLYDKEIPKLGLSNVKKEQILSKEVIPLLHPSDSKNLKDHVQVVTLGTGSALPSIHRNVISTLVRIPYVDPETKEISFQSILLDGGENSLGSMLRNFGHNGNEQLNQVLQELRLIYLSHLHADHHLGIASVISAWFEANQTNDKKLYLVIPWQYNNFITEWYDLEKMSSSKINLDRIVYISCEEFMRSPEPEFKQLSIDLFEKKFDTGILNENVSRRESSPRPTNLIQQLYKDLNILEIQTVRAIHCYWAYSVSINFNLSETENFKVSYSGDTRPNVKFVDIGYGTDLLIHEASLDNELIEEALSKKHSALIEAVRISQLMNCPRVILTHFSTRFSEKHNFIENEEQYLSLTNNLKNYLGRTAHNLFFVEGGPEFVSFNDLQICYAYDMMTVAYNNFDSQKEHYAEITRLSNPDETEEELVKREKELLRVSEKREAKRLMRLGKRKRTMSGGEA